jgi:hypothetical protein
VTRLARNLSVVAILVVSLALASLAGVLVVRYVFPPPAILPNGMREGTPVQILAFLGTFAVVVLSSLRIGLNRLPKRQDGS